MKIDAPTFTDQLLFHLWFPDIFEFKGGIQVYSAFLLEALQSLYPDASYDVFLKHDSRALAVFPVLDATRFHFAGPWPLSLRTLVFASQILGSGLRQRPNLVLASHLNFTAAAAWLKRLSGVPYWAIAHGVEAWDIQRPQLQMALQHADQILCVSSYTRERLLKQQLLNPAKVFLLPNTFDASRFQITPKPPDLLERYGLRADQPVILTVARLDQRERYKGYDQVLQALPEIRQQLPDVRYLLVGEGSDRPRIEQLVTRLKLQDSVSLPGFIADQELSKHYNLCDLFVMPSKGEGFGIVYLEALACGKPVVGGNQDGAIDALAQGEFGVLVNPDDLEEIARVLTRILQGTYAHPILYQPKRLREKVINAFGFEQFTQTLAQLIQISGLGVR